MNPGAHLSIFDKLRLWWHGYCPKHLCAKVMTEPTVGRLCPECELELMRARQDAIARIAAKSGKCGVCGGDHKDYMVHGAALPTRKLPEQEAIASESYWPWIFSTTQSQNRRKQQDAYE